MGDVPHNSEPDTPARQPDFFVGWWEVVFHIRDGEHTDVTDIIEHIDAAGHFTVHHSGDQRRDGLVSQITCCRESTAGVPGILLG